MPAEVTLPSDQEVRVTRQFKAPRDLVFKAYTTPALVRKWLLGPPGWTMPVCEMDVRPGGAYRWRWRSNDGGQEFGFFGTFSEVNAPSKVVHEEHFDPGDIGGPMPSSEPAHVTVEFKEAGSVTTLTSNIRYASKEMRDAAVSTGMTDGMEQSYALLDDLLVSQNT